MKLEFGMYLGYTIAVTIVYKIIFMVMGYSMYYVGTMLPILVLDAVYIIVCLLIWKKLRDKYKGAQAGSIEAEMPADVMRKKYRINLYASMGIAAFFIFENTMAWHSIMAMHIAKNSI